MTNTNTGNAKRASRATLELAKVLSDGEWHNTAYLAIVAGRYIRPEMVWRRAWQHRQKGNMNAGQYQWVLGKLRYWWKVGKVDKEIDGDMTRWRVKNKNWADKYVEYLEHGWARDKLGQTGD